MLPRNNIRKLYAFSFFKMMLFPMAIITLFWKDQIGLTLTEIMLLQAAFSFSSLCLEFPSGYISDRIGYRFALNLACLFGITGWVTYTLAGSFTGVLIAELQLGASYAFISGADSALLYETLRQEGREEDYAKHDGKMTAWAQTGEAVGALGAGVLYGWFPLLPFILQVGIWVAALGMGLNLTKTIVFGVSPLLTVDLALTGLLIGLCTIPGAYTGRWIVSRTPIRIHIVFIEALILAGAGYFLWVAWRGLSG